ncbi:hypothetical protein NHX12_009081, partial [Muraenolepis orangiensis]
MSSSRRSSSSLSIHTSAHYSSSRSSSSFHCQGSSSPVSPPDTPETSSSLDQDRPPGAGPHHLAHLHRTSVGAHAGPPGGAAGARGTSTKEGVVLLGDTYYTSADLSRFQPQDIAVVAYHHQVVIHAEKVMEDGSVCDTFTHNASLPDDMDPLSLRGSLSSDGVLVPLRATPPEARPPEAPPLRATPPEAPPLGARLPEAPPLGARPPETPPLGARSPEAPPLGGQAPSGPPLGARPPEAPPLGARPPAAPPLGVRLLEGAQNLSDSPHIQKPLQMIDQCIVRMLHPQTRCHQPPQTEHCIRPSHSSKQVQDRCWHPVMTRPEEVHEEPLQLFHKARRGQFLQRNVRAQGVTFGWTQLWKALKEYISSFHVTTFGFEQAITVCFLQ